MNVTDQTLDNPDQRMTADVNFMCNSYGEILPDLIIVPFTIPFYTFDAFRRTGWVGPTAMFLYFLLSTIINKVLMSPVVDLTAMKERQEGYLESIDQSRLNSDFLDSILNFHCHSTPV